MNVAVGGAAAVAAARAAVPPGPIARAINRNAGKPAVSFSSLDEDTMTTSSPAKAWCSGGVVPYYATCVRDPFAANASVDPTPRLLGLVPDAMSTPPAMRRVSLGDLPPGSLSAMEARGQAGAAVDGSSSVGGAFGSPTPTPAADPDPDPAATSGAFYTLVPIRPRSRGERRSLRTFAAVSLRPSLAFNTRPRYLSTPPDAFQLHPDIRLYGTTLSVRGG